MAMRSGDGTGAGVEDGTGRRPETPGAGRQAPVLDEILGIVRVIAARTDEDGGLGAGPSREHVDNLARSMEALGQYLEKMRPLLERLAARGPDNGAAAEAAADLATGLRTHMADFGRWVEAGRRARRRWAALAMAAAVPALLLLGVLVEKEFQVIPLHDPSGGWRDHIWEEYGRRIADCAVEARRTGARVECPLAVRAP